MAKLIDMTDKRYGKWTVLQFAGRGGNDSLWRCRCDCGAEKTIRRTGLLHAVKGRCDRCAKLVKPLYREVIRLRAKGVSQSEIARRMKRTPQAISQMVAAIEGGTSGRRGRPRKAK